MKAKGKMISALILAACIAFSCTACGGNALAIEGAALPHYDGVENYEAYDSEVFYKNDLTLFGGDSDVIWVPEERDPVNGGYFYQYTSSNFLSTDWLSGFDHSFGFSCLRSKDLNNWELCGAVDGGYAAYFGKDEWVYNNTWAPEVEYDEQTQMYYLFFSGKTWAEGTSGHEDDGVTYRNNMHFGIMYSEAPQGPFRLLTSEEYYKHVPEDQRVNDIAGTLNEMGETLNANGDVITAKDPPLELPMHFDFANNDEITDKTWAMIDLSPMIDENGDLYIYFSRHWTVYSGGTYDKLSVWGIKMKDWLPPDYDSLRLLALPAEGPGKSWKIVEYDGVGPVYDDSSYKVTAFAEGEDGYYDNDNKLNEGAQVVSHKCSDGVTRYYLTYSQTNFYARNYGVYQAVSESPLGPFTKIGRARSVGGVNEWNDFMTGVGHNAYVEADGEMFDIYWVHSDPYDTSTSSNNGRVYAFDKIEWIYDEELGYEIMYCNGPTLSLQPLPTVYSGLKNVADQATITATNCDQSTVKWLNDGTITTLDYYKDNELRTNGPSVITIEFDEPQDIRAIMIYNSMNKEYAFSQIDGIVFTLAEKPEWYTSSAYNGKMYIQDLPFNEEYYNEEYMRPGGSTLASFNEIKVSKIEISVSSTLTGGEQIGISEIYVLGNNGGDNS